MSNWVKFHEELTEGAKRRLPRAARFIYLELALKARKRRGWIPLAGSDDPTDDVHDLLGGDRAEVAAAIPQLTQGTDPMVRIEDVEGERRLVVTAWEAWNAADDSAARVKRHREKKQGNACNGDVTVGNVTSETLVTGVTALEEKRVEEKRSDHSHTARAREAEPETGSTQPSETTGPEAAEPVVGDPMRIALHETFRKYPAFRGTSERGLVEVVMTQQIAKPLPLPWVVAAIGEAAGAVAAARASGETVNPADLVRRFVKNARNPEASASPSAGPGRRFSPASKPVEPGPGPGYYDTPKRAPESPEDAAWRLALLRAGFKAGDHPRPDGWHEGNAFPAELASAKANAGTTRPAGAPSAVAGPLGRLAGVASSARRAGAAAAHAGDGRAEATSSGAVP